MSAPAQALAAIDADLITTIAQDLIQATGRAEPGTEQSTAQVLADHAQALGLEVSVTEVAPGRPNVKVVLPGGAEPGLLILGHTDVVPPGPGWTREPFSGHIAEGRLYGRGATDMLGGLAAALVAMGALRAAGVQLAGPVELAAVVDEEELGLGIRHYITEPQNLVHAGCVVAEPTDLQVIIAARGASYVEIDVSGQAAHAGDPSQGKNAIYGAAQVIGDLERWHEQMRSEAHPLVGPATWNVGVVAGGVGGSMVPDHCRVSADRRLLPAEDPTVVLEQITQRVQSLGLGERGLGVEVRMPMDMPGFETPADHPLVTACTHAVPASGGPDLPVGGWTAACDGGFLARDAQMPVVVLGPGSVTEQAHRPDESVALADLDIAARSYARIAVTMLGSGGSENGVAAMDDDVAGAER